jgi:hypothetical protein
MMDCGGKALDTKILWLGQEGKPQTPAYIGTELTNKPG